MAGSAGSVELILVELGRALAALRSQLTPAAVNQLMAGMGLNFPNDLATQPAFATAMNDVAAAATSVETLAAQLTTAIEADNKGQMAATAAQLVPAVTGLVAKLANLKSALDGLAAHWPSISAADVHAFAAALPTALFDRVVIEYLDAGHAVISGLLRLAGVIEIVDHPGIPSDPAKPPFESRTLHLDRLAQIMGDPAGYVRNVYGWGGPPGNLQGLQIFQQLHAFFAALMIPSILELPANPGDKPALLLGPFRVAVDGSGSGLEAKLDRGVPPVPPVRIPGLYAGLFCEFESTATIPSGSVISIGPPGGVVVKPASGSPQGEVWQRLVRTGPDAAHPLLIIGQRDGSRLETQEARVGWGVAFTWDGAQGHGAIATEAQLKGARLVLRFSDLDGFLGKLIPASGIDYQFDFGVGWSAQRGLYLTGSGGLETTIGVHASIGPLTLQSLHLGLATAGGALSLETSVTAEGALGPVSAVIDRVGVNTDLTFKTGNLGPANLDVTFRPPNGIGLTVDAGAIVGGGYLFIDAANGRYAGVLELKLYSITVKAIGLIDTRLPDGSRGFSFLIIITADFIPIQLGFGFTLSGVGGLAGINRTMMLDVLRAGMRNHTLNSILFPDDPIHNAPRIISDLRGIFPPADQRYVFGPMLQFGWGTPNLITAAFGVILELPAPVRLAILGQIKAALPAEELALIELHMDVLGAIDFGARKLSIDASLYDSRIVIYSVFGDMAMRLDWGDDPSFALSVGGLHPRFQPPPGFPSLRRMTVSVGIGDNPRFSIDSYYAITSNSIQFGAHAELYVAAFGFALHGWIGWDALFILSPFGFLVEIRAGIDISYDGVSLAGIDVDVMLAGPTPWDFNGQASFHILFISVGMHVHVTFGQDRPPALPKKKVLDPLVAALKAPSSWTAVLPAGSERAVSLAGPKPDAATVVVHPLGSLTVRQTVVPLKTPINKFAHAAPADGDTFEIASTTMGGQAAAQQDVTDMFARGQYVQMSDADSLAARAYERFPSGVTAGSPEAQAGHDSMLEVRLETVYIPDPFRLSVRGLIYAMPAHIHLALAQHGAAALSQVLTSGMAAYTEPGMASSVATSDPSFVVASTDDLSIRYDLTGDATSQHMASAALQSHLATHPEDQGLYQVIPIHEAVAV